MAKPPEDQPSADSKEAKNVEGANSTDEVTTANENSSSSGATVSLPAQTDTPLDAEPSSTTDGGDAPQNEDSSSSSSASNTTATTTDNESPPSNQKIPPLKVDKEEEEQEVVETVVVKSEMEDEPIVVIEATIAGDKVVADDCEVQTPTSATGSNGHPLGWEAANQEPELGWPELPPMPPGGKTSIGTFTTAATAATDDGDEQFDGDLAEAADDATKPNDDGVVSTKANCDVDVVAMEKRMAVSHHMQPIRRTKGRPKFTGDVSAKMGLFNTLSRHHYQQKQQRASGGLQQHSTVASSNSTSNMSPGVLGGFNSGGFPIYPSAAAYPPPNAGGRIDPRQYGGMPNRLTSGAYHHQPMGRNRTYGGVDQRKDSPINDSAAQYSKTNLYIRGLPPATDDEDLRNMCKEYGTIKSTKAIMEKATNQCKGYGFVDFEQPNDAENARADLVSKGIQAQMAKKQQQQEEQMPDPSNLYIANLPQEWNEQRLEDALKEYGPVVSTRILREQDGSSRGVGFARMDSHDVCENIIKTFPAKVAAFYIGAPTTGGGGEVLPRPLLVKYADSGKRPKKPLGGGDPSQMSVMGGGGGGSFGTPNGGIPQYDTYNMSGMNQHGQDAFAMAAAAAAAAHQINGSALTSPVLGGGGQQPFGGRPNFAGVTATGYHPHHHPHLAQHQQPFASPYAMPLHNNAHHLLSQQQFMSLAYHQQTPGAHDATGGQVGQLSQHLSQMNVGEHGGQAAVSSNAAAPPPNASHMFSQYPQIAYQQQHAGIYPQHYSYGYMQSPMQDLSQHTNGTTPPQAYQEMNSGNGVAPHMSHEHAAAAMYGGYMVPPNGPPPPQSSAK